MRFVALLVSPLPKTMIARAGRRKEVERISHVHGGHHFPSDVLSVGHVIVNDKLGDALNVMSKHLFVMFGAFLTST
jgi:hypothetical protein